MKIIKYQTEEEAAEIIARETANGLIMTAVSNITDGNFLGFMDPAPQIIEVTSNQQLADIQNTLDLLLLKQEGIL